MSASEALAENNFLNALRSFRKKSKKIRKKIRNSMQRLMNICHNTKKIVFVLDNCSGAKNNQNYVSCKMEFPTLR